MRTMLDSAEKTSAVVRPPVAARGGTRYGVAVAALAVIITLLMLSSGAPVWAHGGGTVRAIWDDAPGFHMVIETNEDAAAGVFGGVVHVTMIVTSDASATTTVRGLDIEVHGVGPDGHSAGPIRAKQMLNGAYEADLMVRKPGVWRIWIAVDDGANVHEFQFPLEVLARSVFTDLGIVGGLMLVPVLGIAGMVRIARRRQAEAQVENTVA